ncbi:MAG TPA: hemerythrin domain-containing protein [Acidimicrobiia bacterium]|nr:hemerythrin domain-containing protein [Acidimicrobiia bacterium]
MTAVSVSSTLAVELADLEAVEYDVYRDIHKGIRGELFAVVSEAGRVDPAGQEGVEAVGAHWRSIVELLISHAEHEDGYAQPLIEAHLPELAAKIAYDHPRLEQQMATLEVVADRAANAVGEARRIAVHRLYLGLASFTSDYLAHQAVEELDVMPGLAKVIGVPELIALNQEIVASIPPEQMVKTLPLMMQQMNVDDRTELLFGMKMGAPPEVFAGLSGVVRDALAPEDWDPVAARLAI